MHLVFSSATIEHNPPLFYELLAPENVADAPESGWPVLVLAHAATPSYASIAKDGLAIIVKPQFTWNTFEEDRQILDAIIVQIDADYPVDEQRLILHGCSVGGQFAFEYTLADRAASWAPW